MATGLIDGVKQINLELPRDFKDNIEYIRQTLEYHGREDVKNLNTALQKSLGLNDILKEALRDVNVTLIDVGEEFKSNLDYVLRRQHDYENIVAHIPLYVERQQLQFRRKNLGLLDIEFPCKVLFEIRSDLNSDEIGRKQNVQDVLKQKWNYQPVMSQRSEISSSTLEKYEEYIHTVETVCRDRGKIYQIVTDVWDRCTDKTEIRQCGRWEEIDGPVHRPAYTMNQFKVEKLKSNLVEKILTNTVKNIKESVCARVDEHITNELHISAFDKVKIDMAMNRAGENFMVAILEYFLTVIKDAIVFVVNVVWTFISSIDVNSVQWRNEVADATHKSIQEHRNEIVQKIQESFFRQYFEVAEELQKCKPRHRLYFVPRNTEKRKEPTYTKLTSICYGKDSVKHPVVGVRARNLDNVFVVLDHTIGKLDLKTVEEATRAVRVVSDYLFEEQKQISIADRKKINSVIKIHTGKLLKSHSNISMISKSPVKLRAGEIVNAQCIVIYCSCKGIFPPDEPEFPTSIDGIMVDVIEEYCCLSHARGYNDPLTLGCSVGTKGIKKSGTLGIFVSETQNPDVVGFLTCSHVLMDGDKITGTGPSSELNDMIRNREVETTVVQPSFEDMHFGENNCGELHSAIFGNKLYQNQFTGVDVAYVRISERHPINTRLAESNGPIGVQFGPPLMQMGDDDLEHRVYKFGRTTSLTTGIFEMDGTSVNLAVLSGQVEGQVNTYNQYLHNMYQVCCGYQHTPGFDHGDSGAPVYIKKEGKYRIIGMAVGALSNKTIYFVTPIGALVENISPQIKLKET